MISASALHVLGGCHTSRAALSSAELSAVEAADQAYADGWLAGDRDQLMATMTDDAVLMPSGMETIEGSNAIREFWWPPDAPATNVLEFNLMRQELGGRDDFAYVRGSFTLRFEYGGDTYNSRGDYLTLLRKIPQTGWRITHRSWNDLMRLGE